MTSARKLTGFNSGRTDLPKFKRNSATDDTTAGFFGLAKPWGYEAQANPIAAGTLLRNYVRGESDAVVGAATLPFADGMAEFAYDGTGFIKMPVDQWVLPADAEHFAIGFIGEVETTGYPTSSGTVRNSIFGNRAGGNIQYDLKMLTSLTTGAVTGVELSMGTNSVTQILGGFPTDGAKHQFCFEWEKTGPTAMQYRVWIDQAVTFESGSLAYAGTFPQNAGFTNPGFGKHYTNTGYNCANMRIGEMWLERLEGKNQQYLRDFLERDRKRNFDLFG